MVIGHEVKWHGLNMWHWEWVELVFPPLGEKRMSSHHLRSINWSHAEHDCSQETILKRRDGEISFVMQGNHFNLAFITRARLLEKVAMLIYAKYVRFIPCFMFQLSSVICCFVAISAMPNPQAPKGSLVETAESGHFSYDGNFVL